MPQTVIQGQSSSISHVPLEVSSIVEVVSNSGITVYGVVRWLGVPRGKTNEWAGIELVSEKFCTITFCVGSRYGRRVIFCFGYFRTMTSRVALMGSMEARGISPAKGTGHCLFPSQSAALMAGLSAPPQKGRPPNSPKYLQVRHLDTNLHLLNLYVKCFYQ